MSNGGYERASLAAVESTLDALENATADEVYFATILHDARAVAAVAASRADAAGGATFPPEWTIAETGELTINAPNAPSSLLVLRGANTPGVGTVEANFTSEGELTMDVHSATGPALQIQNISGDPIPLFRLYDKNFDPFYEAHGEGYFQMLEVQEPAAPSGNRVRVFAMDDGAGKTQLCALFSSGAVQVMAAQP